MKARLSGAAALSQTRCLTSQCNGAREARFSRLLGWPFARPLIGSVRRAIASQPQRMKKESIKTHLKPYSIFQKRKTTINHAFASALAPNDSYDARMMEDSLRLLGQNPDDNLTCVYCGGDAQTWDHLIGLVKDSQLRGYGHQIGNLIPCCRDCNSKKGSRDWKEFIEAKIKDEQKQKEVTARVQSYLDRYAKPVDIGKIKTEMPEEWARYANVKEQVFELMKEADIIAEKIRRGIG
jgi:5-methylcytosine-specific restriction endonuclease McrA